MPQFIIKKYNKKEKSMNHRSNILYHNHTVLYCTVSGILGIKQMPCIYLLGRPAADTDILLTTVF